VVFLLAVAVMQSKLLVGSRETAAESAKMQQERATQVAATHAPSTQALATDVSVAAATAPVVGQKASAKKSTKAGASAQRKTGEALPQPVKEVVVPLSMVEVSVRHQFKDATLTVWVDDQLALTRPLHGGTQKKLVVFGGVRGMESETLKVPAGKHVLRFRAQTGDQTVDLSKTISADLIGGGDKVLLISFEKRNTVMHVEWQ
jgi:hypothetical protein